MDAASIITKALSEGGFDNARSDVLSWLNERYKMMVVRSEFLRAQITSIGPTVAGQDEYTLADSVADLRALRVGTVPYQRVSLEDMWEIDGAYLRRVGQKGVFAPAYGSTGTAKIRLYPEPDDSGDTIEAFVSLFPDALTDSASSTPVVYADFHTGLIDGTIAEGLLRVEERADSALVFEQRFNDAVEGVRRRVNSRVGSGPTMIRWRR